MVAGDQAVKPVFAGGLVTGQPVLEKFVDAGAGIPVEVSPAGVAGLPVCRAVVGAQEPVVAVAAVLQHKVHVKAVFQRDARFVPFADEHGFRVFGMEHIRHFPPDRTSMLFAAGVVLDQAERHIHPEPVAAHGQPEPHHVLDGLHRSAAVRVAGGFLPALVDLAVAIVQRGLALEEVQDIGAVARRFPADERHTVAAREAVVGPDIPPGILVFPGPAAGPEPGVLLAGMAGHQVQQHVHVAGMGRAEQRGQVLVGAVARRHLFVVPHIIACVLERRVEAGVDPQGVAAQIPDIIQPGRDAGQIPDAVAVGIAETLRIDFVKYRVFQPLFHCRASCPAPLAGTPFFFILTVPPALVNLGFYAKHSIFFLLFCINICYYTKLLTVY